MISFKDVAEKRGALPKGMFDDLVAMGRPGEPDPEDMELAEKRIRYDKYTKIRSFNVRTFNLGLPEDAEDYRSTIVDLYALTVAKKVNLVCYERKFVQNPPSWFVHMEWYEFELGIKDLMAENAAAGAATEKNNETEGD